MAEIVLQIFVCRLLIVLQIAFGWMGIEVIVSLIWNEWNEAHKFVITEIVDLVWNIMTHGPQRSLNTRAFNDESSGFLWQNLSTSFK